MKRFCLAAAILLATGLFVGFSTAAGSSPATAAPAASSASGQIGTLYVGFTVSNFFVRAKKLYARGTKIATLTGLDGTRRIQRTPYVARVTASKGRVISAV